jgi:DNA recombination protein RmuC
MTETILFPWLIAGFSAGISVIAMVFAWRGRAGGDGTANAATSELTGKIGQLADAQMQLQRVIAEQLQGQERNLSKNMDERLGDLKSRMAVFDAAQEKITQLSAQVVSLQDVLSNSKSRGAFGEVQMHDLITDVLPPSVYSFQETLSNGARVDCLLRLPNPPGPIAIDAKFPLDGWRALQAARDDGERTGAARNFTQHLKKHIDAIASKYIIAGETAESALLFLPSEAVFAELHVNFPDILQYSYQKRVWIVSPTTMMATLNTVRAILRDVKLREQAGIIQNEVRLLLEDTARLEERMTKLSQYFNQSEEMLRQMGVSAEKINRRGQKIMEIEGDNDSVEIVSRLRAVE